MLENPLAPTPVRINHVRIEDATPIPIITPTLAWRSCKFADHMRHAHFDV